MAIKNSNYYNNSEKLIKRVCAINYYSHYGKKKIITPIFI